MQKPLFAVICLAVSCLTASPIVSARQANTRTIYVSALDNKGNPVTDMQAAEFEVKGGGKVMEITKAEPAQTPMRVSVIVSDAGTGGFQQGLANFMQKLLGRAEFSLVSVINQPEVVSDFSGEGAALRDAVRKIGPRGRQPGAAPQVMEAIQDALKRVGAEGRRPVILVLRVGGEAITPIDGDDVREQLRKSGALLYVVSTLGAQRAAAPSARPGISNEQAQMQDSEIANSNLNVAQVFGDGTRESGGRHDQVVSTTLVPTIERIADELLNQYALTCALPDRVKPNDKLSVASKRKGIKLQAPARLQ
jgi:hypothetical protein